MVRSLLQYRADIRIPAVIEGHNGITPLQIAMNEGHTNVQLCLQDWLCMSAAHQDVVATYGWEYYDLERWRQGLHQQFPAHLSSQTVATTMAIDHLLPRENGRVASLLTGAIDAHKRHVTFEL